MRRIIAASVVTFVLLIVAPTLALWTAQTTGKGAGKYGAWAVTPDTAILMGGSAGGNTAGFMGVGVNTSTSAATGVSAPVPVAGTITNLRISTDVSVSTLTVTVLKNGAATPVTCSISSGTTCADTTHTATYAAGDLLALSFTVAGASSVKRWGAVFTAS